MQKFTTSTDRLRDTHVNHGRFDTFSQQFLAGYMTITDFPVPELVPDAAVVESAAATIPTDSCPHAPA